MGWIWNDDDDSVVGKSQGSSNPNGDGDRFSTRKMVTSQCRTEEVEPGKYIRKCEKTERIFKDCFGRPSEMVHSNKEYTEEDVTDEMVKGSFPLTSSDHGQYFTGLRSDIEAIERSFFGNMSRFFEAAEDMKNEFFNSASFSHILDHDSSSSHKKHGVPIEGPTPGEAFPKSKFDGDVDLSGLARDV